MEHISIFIPTLRSGGAEKQAALLASLLSSKYIVHFVVLYGEIEKSKYVLNILENADVQIYFLKGSLLSKVINYGRILKDNNVLCSFNYLTKCDFLGSLIEKIFGVKKRYNGIRNSDLEKWKTFLELISHNYFASGTIFNCFSGEKVFVERGLKKDKCFTIPNCFLDIASPIKHENSAIKRIITVARFQIQKDYETSIKAIALLKKQRSNFIFELCGYGPLENQIKAWIKKYNVEDVVNIHINPNNIPQLLKDSDVYLSTSLFEGTSNSIMEAMNWSLPVVATNVGDNNYLVRHGENGFIHNIGDAENIAKSLYILLDNAELRNNMGIASNRILAENYSAKLFVKNYLKVIEM